MTFTVFSSSCGFHKPEVKVFPDAQEEDAKILFIAFDGIGYDMMDELKGEGHFRDFEQLRPLIVTFPSVTTIGFTGIFKPLDVGKVPGYEVRFYSFAENRVIGGTPWEIYKIHINYKDYFDAFRHTMFEKSVMYTFPGVAGKQDLLRTEKLLLTSDKNVLMTYLGGTDGAQHILGKKRTKRFMVFVDHFLLRMKKKYEKAHDQPLRVVLYSDHGFHYSRLKMISTGAIGRALEPAGLRVRHKLEGPEDVVLVKYGLLSAGVMMTAPQKKEAAARAIRKVPGIDLVFWPEKNRVHMVNSQDEEAYFEYRWPGSYRYVPVSGDPLGYKKWAGRWIPDATWKKTAWNEAYPDAGYRLYESFFNLVENRASVLFSTKPNYQFGGLAALAGTKLKWGGHKGTHGGLFQDTSFGMVMTDDPAIKLPPAIRYDELFKIFLPRVSKATQRHHGKKEIQFLASPRH